MGTEIERLDPNLGNVDASAGLAWYDARELVVEGRGWQDTAEFYDRLPARAQGIVRAPIWNLSRHSAGMCVRFQTDAMAISARWVLRFPSLAMDHMPATGVSGVDLYVEKCGTWHWLGVGRGARFPVSSATLVSGLSPGWKHCMLYLPLYNGVARVEVGVPHGQAVARAPAWGHAGTKPICFYGTSIVQGGCASRPGMAYPAILGRWLRRPTINLGFSGNGKAEPEMGRLLAELDPSVYVVDCLPNLDETEVEARMSTFLSIMHEARPHTPLVLVENIRYQHADFVTTRQEDFVKKNQALRKVFNHFRSSGWNNMYYVAGVSLLGEDGEATVDGTHPTDVGFLRIAAALEPVLRPLV